METKAGVDAPAGLQIGDVDGERFLAELARIRANRINLYGQHDTTAMACHFGRIANVWSELIAASHCGDNGVYVGPRLMATDVATMLAALKLLRIQVAPDLVDSYIDLANYGIIAAELQRRWNESLEEE